MKSIAKSILLLTFFITAGLSAGCGGGGDSGAVLPATSTAAPSGAAATPPTDTASAQAVVLYEGNCADCHGILDVSTKKGITLARLQNAITNNIGGMGYLSALSAADMQSIVSVLSPAPVTPPAATDGAALYAANCAGCHGPLASSTKKGMTLARLQSAISGNIGNMGFLSTLTNIQQQAIVTALAPVSPPPVTPPAGTDGAALYAANCAGCHGPLASSTKQGTTLARLQNAIIGNIGNMSYLATLTSAQQQAIVTALTPATPPPTTLDGAALYSANCAGCHGPLATSGKAGATAARTQTAINGNIGGMGYLSTLTSAQVSAIAAALATVTPPPNPTPTCGSCHALPPLTGKHSFHNGRNIACSTCHGSGYSTTTVNTATHNNGVKNLTTTIGWNASRRSCSNSCHSSKSW